ncbi:hypothetical protein BH23PLA1_BH23PLA1_38790 [soil metagenome]
MSHANQPQGESNPRTAPPSFPPEGPPPEHAGGLGVDIGGVDDESLDRRLAAIELSSEEVAANWKPTDLQPLAPEVRYLHISRTIHQLVTDRNRSVGIFLFVASVLFGASTALLNAPRDVVPIIPLKTIQYWCLPVTFGTLGILAIFVSLILIRSRIGLIYEVAKMNTLMGIPYGRVQRVNPLSIFFLMHLLVVALGAVSAGLTAGMMASHLGGPLPPTAVGLGIGLLYLVFFMASYYITILLNTSDDRLKQTGG